MTVRVSVCSAVVLAGAVYSASHVPAASSFVTAPSVPRQGRYGDSGGVVALIVCENVPATVWVALPSTGDVGAASVTVGAVLVTG